MSCEHLDLLQDEDEDIIVEGSELHQALTSMGYTNFGSTPRVTAEPVSLEVDLSPVKDYRSINQSFYDKVDTVCSYVLQENKLREGQLKIILESEILLDDHKAAINDFLIEGQTSYLRKYLDWIPLIGSTITAISPLVGRRKSITATIMTLTIFGMSTYVNFKHWLLARNLKHLVKLQNDLHELFKQSLKILRRAYGKRSIITEVHEKEELLGSDKHNIMIHMKEVLTEVFENLSTVYYAEASQIISTLPDSLRLDCTLTNVETECEQEFDCNSYEKLKSLYYTFLLVQSEMMFIMANAYNGKTQNTLFKIPKSKLSQSVKNLTKPLAISYSRMSNIMQTYQLCEIKPVQRVLRGSPTSKWHDSYIHLDLTSQRIQLAYKEVASILEYLDLHSEKDEDNLQLVESITEKMNEAYKQIENARSFAEFSSLLIAKAQHKPGNVSDKNENENLFPTNFDNRKIILIDKEPEIEDEVFEEYIKEEYLKPLYENSDKSVIQNFRLDKLLEKNFMSELRDALIEKQKSMTERELKALKRMYDKVQKDAGNKTETDICPIPEKSIETEEPVAPTSVPPPPQPPLPPPPPPPPPPRVLENTIIAESHVEEEEKEQKKTRTPVPLPRVKMLKPEDEMLDVQRFSINQCAPMLKFPTIRLTEETFIGSGENSEEEEENLESNSDDDDDDDNDDDNDIVEN
ncbi:uncharacterized protein LOC100678565 isoform X1 [Nasonia vitripennis]|uniref:Vezatin n=1 Tax=Nasonia vitripennis TaxID=7425 RepID=A0A7M7PW44_NASVI|nr:uncharacterized protein LOC100678565 isoform X1 [Nasonia vitripennis]